MRTSLLALLCAVVFAACSSTSSPKASGGDGGSSGSSGSSGGSGGSSGGSGGSSGGLPPADAGPVDGDVTALDSGDGTQSYTVQFGPISVPPGTENTQCIVVPLGNAASIHVGQIHDLLGNASHHMILYKVAAQAAQTTPFDCQPFQDTLNPADGNPLVISQKKDDLLTLPPGVAFTLDANQMVRLEMHYINADPNDTVTLVTTSTLTTIPDSAYQYDASFLFIGDPDISIPPQSNFTLGPVYFQVPPAYAQSNFFAMTGHEHQWGTKVQIWSAANASDPGSLIYTNTSWSDPVTTDFTPPFNVQANGGFRFQCDWYNATTSTVSFGESADDEMCFFWAYYYPANPSGAQMCFHTDRLGGSGTDACCPGSALCSALGGQ
jgi:Copper type II ascorbate-dependent monooxygenase, C-terminal domain